ncbi:MAG: FAD-binding oxidoreductase [Deltaproteobacteria bacterium]|nr:FAD-binding oxidoreductase [Deltaproteobacteria bacterium]
MMIDKKDLDAFKASLHGELLQPSDSGYDEARSIWNAMIDRRPDIIARCRGVADVVACVNFARGHSLKLSIKGGGHNIAGLAVCDGGIMLDMSLMRGVWVDPISRTARAQAGCLLSDVDRETQLHGLAAVLGFVSNTGTAGLTLGGGFGYLTRRFGWTTDNLLSMEVVTAEGRIVRANENENSDLFWGLCGGGGNFGVVTNFEYKLHLVGPEVMAGAIAWRAEDSSAVLEMFRAVMEKAPPELACIAGLRIAPPAPWLAKDIHGKPIVALFVCHSGQLAEGEKLVAPIKAFGKPVGDIVQRRSYVSQQSLLDATQPKGRRYYWKSEYLPDLKPDLLAKTISHAKAIPSPHSAILLFPLDGALNRLAEDCSAVGNRDAAWVLNIAASWEKSEDDRTNVEWARAAWQDIRSFSTGGTYVNFLTEEEGDERIHAAYGDNYERLIEVKTKWDAKNLFRMNKNIVPVTR